MTIKVRNLQGHSWVKSRTDLHRYVVIEISDVSLVLAFVHNKLDSGFGCVERYVVERQPRDPIVDSALVIRQGRWDGAFVQSDRINGEVSVLDLPIKMELAFECGVISLELMKLGFLGPIDFPQCFVHSFAYALERRAVIGGQHANSEESRRPLVDKIKSQISALIQIQPPHAQTSRAKIDVS
jgi:hypothetical protein